jgi:HEAT repeat protein
MTTPLLLDDDQMQRFIAHGYLCLQTQLPESFHAQIYERFDGMIGTVEEGRNPGNNLLPLVPELEAVFADPVVTGALTSVVGPGYVMHPHRALHNNLPGSAEQTNHKDSYWGFRSRVRNHHPRWVMIMYVPQKTPLAQGPTGVIPGSQYQMQRPDPAMMPDMAAELEAGGFLLIHYDVWHRKMKNMTNRNRFMMKFEFARMVNPTGPTWNHRDPEWKLTELPPIDMTAVWRRQWDWLRGAKSGSAVTAVDGNGLRDADPHRRLAAINAVAGSGRADDFVAELKALLDDACEPVSIDAAYALAGAGEAAVTALRDAVGGEESDQRERIACAAACGLVEIGLASVPALLELLRGGGARARKLAASALGEIVGTSAEVTAALLAALGDEDVEVRVNAVEALGWKAASPSVVAGLSAALRDPAPDVRYSAAFSLGQLGPNAEAAVPALAEALHDENRYVPGYAVEALERIATPQAIGRLIPFLKSARWCPLTSPESIY